MADNLVIVESPAKAKTIQKFLGNDYIVKSSFGHIRDLQDNKLSIDIEHDFQPEYVIPAEKKKVVAELKKASEEVSHVWLASDEDREGEAISWHLAQTLGLDEAKTSRIVFHEITKTAIQNAISNPRGIDLQMVNSQQARRVLDRLVGFELSPVLWRKVQRGLSAGRVQSVALRLVVDKEREVMAFSTSAYYKVEGSFVPEGSRSRVKAVLDTRFESMEDARRFLEDSIGANYTISQLETKDGNRFPAPPFTTSTLQQEAARKLHFPVSTTMRVAQSLYEKGLITYMRTDSTNLSSLAINTSKDFIVNTYGEEYSHPRQFHTHSKGAQEAHEAIRPTYMGNTSIEGTLQEQKLYNLIWKRTIASQMADAKVANTSIKLSSDKREERFSIAASRVLFDGFLKVYLEGKDDEDTQDNEDMLLPELHLGQKMTDKSISADCKFTQAPSRYTEGTLVKKLEELGIGRPSTYASIITTLTTGRGYLTRSDMAGHKENVTNLTLKGGEITTSAKVETVGAEKGKLVPQEIGMMVSDYLLANFPDIMNYDFTASVEAQFDEIAEGNTVWNNVIRDFYGPFHLKVEETKANREFVHNTRELGTDPVSGLPVSVRFGQFGPFAQIGEGEGRKCASLKKGQLIEGITLEEALKLFELPRTVGEMNGAEIVATTGRFGPYLKYAGKNISIPKGKDPVSISLEECMALITESESKTPENSIILEFKDKDIAVINGRYGPYIKHDGKNFKLPKGTDAGALTEEECLKIISQTAPSASGFKKKGFTKKQK